ncbi:MAG: molybdenum cofactor guanylyltransferase [Acidimicrobiales bacterium]|nr:molybdenum cofactor guanylyltransferase [Acidimicrobiales bacterium]MDP6901262.1 molybdenum cofactor guanylyltransferase [Acidimicrobiales bacterium]
MKITGAVLCGGASTRMRQDKASLMLTGRPMAEWVADAMREAGVEPVIALGGQEGLSLPVVPDEIEDQGPLYILISALERLGDILVCPCDVPLASAKLFRSIVDAGAGTDKPVVLAKCTQLQPLIGLYKASSIDLLKAGYEGGKRGPKLVLEEHDVEVVDASAEETQNINTPAQFKALVDDLTIRNHES